MALHASQSHAASPRVLSCPVCDGSLSAFTFNGVEVDVCRNKGCGTWFDYSELVEVEQAGSLDYLDRAFEGTHAPRPVKDGLEKDPMRHCPRCQHGLARYEWNAGTGIVLDRCVQCNGLWLDAGELEGYAGFVKRFREQPPELTPELRAKLELANIELETAMDDVTRQVVRWDAWLLDDAVRGLLKGVLNRLS